MTAVFRRLLAICWLTMLGVWPVLASDNGNGFDPEHTRLGFELRTRWGMKLEGLFPHYDGEVGTLPDGRQQVHLRMYTRQVEIVDHPRYTQWARSEKFFGADRYPVVVFVSKPYDAELLRHGGELAGDLIIRGISRPRSLMVEPATCERPAKECDVVATGAVRRSDYDMDDWMLAVNDRVVFVLRARLRDEAAK